MRLAQYAISSTGLLFLPTCNQGRFYPSTVPNKQTAQAGRAVIQFQLNFSRVSSIQWLAKVQKMTDSSTAELPRGKVLVNEQSIPGALIGGLSGAVIGFFVYVMPFYFGHGTGFALPAAGIITGLMVQFCGRGIEAKYGLIGVAFTVFSHVAGWGFIGISGIGAIMILPSLALAFMLSFRRLSPDDQKAYTMDNLD